MSTVYSSFPQLGFSTNGLGTSASVSPYGFGGSMGNGGVGIFPAGGYGTGIVIGGNQGSSGTNNAALQSILGNIMSVINSSNQLISSTPLTGSTSTGLTSTTSTSGSNSLLGMPKGQGILAQLLGPIGGTSSRMFGDIPILGDLLNFTSPVALDLNGDGKINVTGSSTAKDSARTEVGDTVEMDLTGSGVKQQVEWLDGSGDAMLVDNRDGQAVHQGVDGNRLFGDQGGVYNNGYEKLAKLDANQDGQLTGAELSGLQAWMDNGDGKVEDGELADVTALGVSSLSTGMQLVKDANGDDLMRSLATINGKNVMTEDVWFASK